MSSLNWYYKTLIPDLIRSQRKKIKCLSTLKNKDYTNTTGAEP